MSDTAAKLLAEFEALPIEEKQEFAREFLRRLPLWDSGPLHSEEVIAASHEIATTFEREEHNA